MSQRGMLPVDSAVGFHAETAHACSEATPKGGLKRPRPRPRTRPRSRAAHAASPEWYPVHDLQEPPGPAGTKRKAASSNQRGGKRRKPGDTSAYSFDAECEAWLNDLGPLRAVQEALQSPAPSPAPTDSTVAQWCQTAPYYTVESNLALLAAGSATMTLRCLQHCMDMDVDVGGDIQLFDRDILCTILASQEATFKSMVFCEDNHAFDVLAVQRSMVRCFTALFSMAARHLAGTNGFFIQRQQGSKYGCGDICYISVEDYEKADLPKRIASWLFHPSITKNYLSLSTMHQDDIQIDIMLHENNTNASTYCDKPLKSLDFTTDLFRYKTGDFSPWDRAWLRGRQQYARSLARDATEDMKRYEQEHNEAITGMLSKLGVLDAQRPVEVVELVEDAGVEVAVGGGRVVRAVNAFLQQLPPHMSEFDNFINGSYYDPKKGHFKIGRFTYASAILPKSVLAQMEVDARMKAEILYKVSLHNFKAMTSRMRYICKEDGIEGTNESKKAGLFERYVLCSTSSDGDFRFCYNDRSVLAERFNFSNIKSVTGSFGTQTFDGRGGVRLEEAGYRLQIFKDLTGTKHVTLRKKIREFFQKRKLYSNGVCATAAWWENNLFTEHNVFVCLATDDLQRIAAAMCFHVLTFTNGNICIVLKLIGCNSNVLNNGTKFVNMGKELLRLLRTLGGVGDVVFAYCTCQAKSFYAGTDFVENNEAAFIALQLATNLKSNLNCVDWEETAMLWTFM